MSKTKPIELWIKDDKNQVSTMCYEHYRYCDTEVTIDPKCAENYNDFKNAIHVIEYSAFDELQKQADALADVLRAITITSSRDSASFEASKALKIYQKFKKTRGRHEALSTQGDSMIPAQEKKEVREFDVERAKQYGRELFGGAPDTIGQAYVLQAMRHQFELDKQAYDELLKEREDALKEADKLAEALASALGFVVSYGMQTHSAIAYKEAQQIDELLKGWKEMRGAE